MMVPIYIIWWVSLIPWTRHGWTATSPQGMCLSHGTHVWLIDWVGNVAAVTEHPPKRWIRLERSVTLSTHSTEQTRGIGCVNWQALPCRGTLVRACLIYKYLMGLIYKWRYKWWLDLIIISKWVPSHKWEPSFYINFINESIMRPIIYIINGTHHLWTTFINETHH